MHLVRAVAGAAGLFLFLLPFLAQPAAADPCVRVAGIFQSDGCVAAGRGRRPGGEHGSGPGARGDGGAVRPVFAPDPRSPAPLPPVRFHTKSGPTTIDDLALVPDKDGGYRGARPGFRFRIAPDGAISFDDRGAVEVSALQPFGELAAFDLTDAVIRLQGGDPYSYDKALVAALTRPMREAMTDAERVQRLRRALAAWPAHLAQLWGTRALDARARRALLFRLWDELIETGATPEADAAAQARAMVLRFIRLRLPAGGVDAYTAGELAELNARRRSRAAFAPYAPEVSPP
jgi:hypothetical protein